MKAIGTLPARLARTPGGRLPQLLKHRLQRLFGTGLGDVRLVVSDAPARLRARAFALGRTVHVAPELLHAGAAAQRAVLGHEIAHVLQQRMGATRRHVRPEPHALEREAARAGRRVAAGRAVALRPRTPARPADRVQRIKLSIRGTRDGNLDAATLLNLMDSAIASRLADAPGCARVDDVVTVTQGGHWLDLLGKLAMGTAIVPNNVRRDSILPVSLKIGADGYAMQIEQQGQTERIHFPLGALRWADVTRIDTNNTGLAKVDLNYQQIADGFRKLNNSGRMDPEVAENMLLLMRAKPLGRNFAGGRNSDPREFIEAMVALMFGVEASRFPSAFVTSLMLLDLVRGRKCYGREGTKRFTLKGAFDKPDVKFDFDCLYGGKFPCAVHTPGKGNAANRRMLGQLGGMGNDDTNGGHFSRTEGMQMTMELNHRFVVPRREVTLMIHWIEASTEDLATLTRNAIQQLIQARIGAAISADGELPPVLPFAPRRDTGLHSTDVPGQRTQVRMGTTVYYQEYSGGRRPKIGQYYHTANNCKLFGGRTPASRNLLTSSFRHNDQTGIPAQSAMKQQVIRTENDLAVTRQYLCPHCAS